LQSISEKFTTMYKRHLANVNMLRYCDAAITLELTNQSHRAPELQKSNASFEALQYRQDLFATATTEKVP